ncbi:MAG: glycosyltransferase family 4 protein, partial [Bacteroidota bacterium]
ATERLATLLASSMQVVRVNLREWEDKVVDVKGRGNMMQKIGAYRKAARRLKLVVKANPGAIVIWTAPSPELMGHFRDLLTILPALKGAGKIYGVIHWGRFSRLFSNKRTALTAKILLNRVDGLVFLNENRADDCHPWVVAETRLVVPNVLDEAVVCSAEEVGQKLARKRVRGKLKILFLSHMIQEKGYLDVLESVRLLQEKAIACEVIFVGQWMAEEDKLAFEQKVARYKLDAIVTHLGVVRDRNKIKDLQLEADVFVLPSYMVEGQPLTIIEAMSAGSPVVVSNVGGMIGMIEDGKEGFVVEPQNPKAIAEAVLQYQSYETWQAHAEAARKRYLQDYSADQVLKKWLKLVS